MCKITLKNSKRQKKRTNNACYVSVYFKKVTFYGYSVMRLFDSPTHRLTGALRSKAISDSVFLGKVVG